MAGGKETPRQKMIGMMYLVLTALLALQVSNAVLEKFVFIDQALKAAGDEIREKNVGLVTSIQQEVEKKGNRGSDKQALAKANEVRTMTGDILKFMDETRDQMVDKTGGYDENNQLVGAKDYDIVANWMIKEGHGDVLKQRLNDYAKKLEELTGSEFQPLAKDAAQLDIAKNDPDQRNKDFKEYYFGQTPTAAGMATISHLESEVLNYETKALGDLAEQVGAKDFEATDVFPLVRPTQNVVAAGSYFEADLFIAASSKSADPTFTYNGTEVEKAQNEYGIAYGKIKFKATPGNYDPKTLQAEKTFEAKIALADTAYTVNHKYFVIKPVIQVRSAALSALYMNCGNPLSVQVPALGTNYNPNFSSGGTAEIVKGNRPGMITVVPKGRSKVKLTVINDGSTLGTEEFDVKPVPPPNIEIESRGRPVDLEKGVPAASMSALKISAEAEANFAREAPDDSRYRVRRVEVKLARAGRQVRAQKFTSENIDLRSWRSALRPGDNIVIKIENVTRRTYLGENERARPQNTIYSIPIN